MIMVGEKSVPCAEDNGSIAHIKLYIIYHIFTDTVLSDTIFFMSIVFVAHYNFASNYIHAHASYR